MARQGRRRPRPPLEQSFEKVGTFHTNQSGAIIPDDPKASKEEERLKARINEATRRT